MSAWALVTRAVSGRSMMRGTTMAARMLRITTTTITSIKVKPRSAARDDLEIVIDVVIASYLFVSVRTAWRSAYHGRCAGRVTAPLLHQLIQIEDRQQNRQHDHQHHAAHDQDQQWTEQLGDGGDQYFHFALLRIGGALKHLFELAAGLATREEMDGHGRELAAAFECGVQGRALAHPPRRLFHRRMHRHIADHTCRDAERLQHRHAAAGEDAEGAREARGDEDAHQLRNHWQLQQYVVKPALGTALAERHAREHRRRHHGDQHIHTITASEVAYRDEPAGEWRQLLANAFERLHALRHHVHHQQRHHQYRHDQHQQWIDERQRGFLLQGLARLGVIGEAFEHAVEIA